MLFSLFVSFIILKHFEKCARKIWRPLKIGGPKRPLSSLSAKAGAVFTDTQRPLMFQYLVSHHFGMCSFRAGIVIPGGAAV